MFAASVVVFFAAPVAPAPRAVTPYRVFKPLPADWRPAPWEVKPIPMLEYPPVRPVRDEYRQLEVDLERAGARAAELRAKFRDDPELAERCVELRALEREIALKRPFVDAARRARR